MQHKHSFLFPITCVQDKEALLIAYAHLLQPPWRPLGAGAGSTLGAAGDDKAVRHNEELRSKYQERGASATAPAADGHQPSPAMPQPASGSTHKAPAPSLSTGASVPVLLAGSELGLYNFASAALEATGLQVLSATHATFLIQFAAVLTPLLSWLGGEHVAPQVWAAVALGVAGSCLVAYDSIAPSLGPALGSDLGDVGLLAGGEAQGVALVLGACLCNSLAVVRLGRHAPCFNAVELSAAKKVSMCAVSVAWLVGVGALQQPAAAAPALQAAVQDGGAPATDVAAAAAEAPDLVAGGAAPGPFPWLPRVSPSGWLLLLYSALGPGALATLLGAQGQRTVPAVQAQILLSLAPLWSALFAQLALGGEEMGPAAWVGGAMVLLSVMLAQLGCSSPQQHRA